MKKAESEGVPMECVFCKIRDGQIPSFRVYEDQRTLAFMDINPLNPGHCLVVTKAHAPSIFEAEPADLQAAIVATQKVATAVRRAIGAHGLNVLQANGAAAFQSVPHLHFHVIPRFDRDGKGFDWPLVRGDMAEIERSAEKIRAAL
jgi:histidine triad (HIT) family protein